MAPNTRNKPKHETRIHQILVNSGTWIVALWAPSQLYLNSREFFNKYTLFDWIFLGCLILGALLLFRKYGDDPRRILFFGLVANTIVGFIAFFSFPILDYGKAIPAVILQIFGFLPSRKGALEYAFTGFSALLIAGGTFKLWATSKQRNATSAPGQMGAEIDFLLSIGLSAGIYAIITLLIPAWVNAAFLGMATISSLILLACAWRIPKDWQDPQLTAAANLMLPDWKKQPGRLGNWVVLVLSALINEVLLVGTTLFYQSYVPADTPILGIAALYGGLFAGVFVILACIRVVRGRLYTLLTYSIALISIGFLFWLAPQGGIDIIALVLLAGVACTCLTWDLIARASRSLPVKTTGFWLVLGWLVAAYVASQADQGFFKTLLPLMPWILVLAGIVQGILTTWLLRHAPALAPFEEQNQRRR